MSETIDEIHYSQLFKAGQSILAIVWNRRDYGKDSTLLPMQLHEQLKHLRIRAHEIINICDDIEARAKIEGG